MPELRHLRYFAAVADELNFSRAAQRLHMAQPPLSAAIRQLERELDVQLFTRTSREVRLTEAGQAFLRGAQRTLAEADRAVQDARSAAAGELGSLRIGYSWSVRFDTLPALGRALHATHPGVDLLAQEMWNADMGDALARGIIDVAVAVCPEIAAELDVEPIRREAVMALFPETHRLARARSISLSSLSGEQLVLFPRELAPRLHDVFVALYRRAGFEPRFRTESFHAGWDFGILPDIGAVALVPASVSTGLPETVVAVAISEPVDTLETCLVWRRDSQSRAAAVFGAAARGLFHQR